MAKARWMIVGWMLLGAPATARPVPTELAAAAKAYDEAQVKGDGRALERLLADDYVLINSRGDLETKTDLIRDYTAPGFTLEPFVVEAPVERLWRDGAVLGGIATLKGLDQGRRYEARLRFADVWARRGGRWQVIYTHVSRPPGGAAPH